MITGIFLLFIVHTAATTCCPDGWVQHGGSCYTIITSQRDWTEAATDCGIYGAHLIHIETKAENDFIKNYLKKFAQAGAKLTSWIGLSDMLGSWQWTPQGGSLSFTDWIPGQSDREESNSNCGILSAPSGFSWEDLGCNIFSNFICEKEFFFDRGKEYLWRVSQHWIGETDAQVEVVPQWGKVTYSDKGLNEPAGCPACDDGLVIWRGANYR
ncbi:perlucin-like [Haliotis asinina]|uniref:perlucin-like n=1 Tax=Haliotis asinina TaxID=109174 RepID=UPI003531824A